ncbi:hypothetical protein COLO4_13822 [Corchorus olitorius]|uniref:Uncharacterized protein n=1 Tax=Corchorus olitorius TaxID=93759 RepID=A0A1R3JUS6_9ROSI|nr:hypothetical protein COLO4_13822 [Corchorus olitorius]
MEPLVTRAGAVSLLALQSSGGRTPGGGLRELKLD